MNKNYFLLMTLLFLLPGCFSRWSCTPRFMNRVRPCGHVGPSTYCATEPQADSNIVYQDSNITYPNEVSQQVVSEPMQDEAISNTDFVQISENVQPLMTPDTRSEFDLLIDDIVEEPEMSQADVLAQEENRREEDADYDIFEDIERANAFDEEKRAQNKINNDFADLEVADDTVLGVESDIKLEEKSDVADEPQEKNDSDLDPVLFDFDKKEMSDKQEQALSRNVNKIKNLADKGYKIVIAGHADKIGKDWYNEQLSRERAQAVATYLKDKGVNEGNIIIEAHGCKQPIVEAGNSRKQAANRRVEIHV